MYGPYLESSSQLGLIKNRLHRQAQLPISNDILHSHLTPQTAQFVHMDSIATDT